MRSILFRIEYCLLLGCVVFILGSNISSAMELETGEATDITSNSATLHGTVISGRAPNLWFQYGTGSGSYTNSEVVHDWFPGKKEVSARISELSAVTTYYYRIAGHDTLPGTPLPMVYGNEKFFTTLEATPTPMVTPTPVCEAESIEASPKTLKLQREESGDVTVTVTGSEGCPVVGETVTAKIKSGKRRISVTPLSQNADAGGVALFTIAATKKTGNAKMKFKTASGLRTTVTVKVGR